MEVKTGEDFNQIRIFVDRDAILMSKFDQFFGNQSGSFADNPWGCFFVLIVPERDGFFSGGFVAGVLFLGHYEFCGHVIMVFPAMREKNLSKLL